MTALTTRDLGPLADDPETLRQAEIAAERRELFRIAAMSALINGGTHLDPEQLARVKQWAKAPPYGKPLSDGSPARAHSEGRP